MTKDHISDETLDAVAGGLNPQPLPPGPPPPDLFALRSVSSFFSHFAINQHSFAVNFLRFR
jgi:hypothetical protein